MKKMKENKASQDVKAKKSPPLHGGDVLRASHDYNIPREQWLDLSTGINPEPYPVSNVAYNSFFELPYIKPEFNDAVARYYTHDTFLAVAGTQVAIQALPQILANDAVLLPDVGYQEHALHWQKSGAKAMFYAAMPEGDLVTSIHKHIEHNSAQHIVIINPNNPTTACVSKQHIFTWAKQLDAGYYIIVDEAFVDAEPKKSVLTVDTLPDNVIILRSFGKFFGLAGVRLGFIFAHEKLLHELKDHIGLWQVNGPAQDIAIQALNNMAWQERARVNIIEANQCTQRIFLPLATLRIRRQYLVMAAYHNPLFSSYVMPVEYAYNVHHFLARHAILTRVILLENKHAILRVGNVSQKSPSQLSQLQRVIHHCVDHLTTDNHSVLCS